MRITETRLRQVIRSTLKEEATESDIYGKYLFGDERGFKEPNTEKEVELRDRFNDAFIGFMGAVRQDNVDQLVRLRDEDKYTDVLEVPHNATRAWRVIEIDIAGAPDALVPGIDKETADAQKTFKEPKLFTGNIVMPLHRYAANSWTISYKALAAMVAEDLGHGDHVVILSADLTSQRDKFLLNPKNLQDINTSFSWQDEIWQVEPVVCDKWVVFRRDASVMKSVSAVMKVRQ